MRRDEIEAWFEELSKTRPRRPYSVDQEVADDPKHDREVAWFVAAKAGLESAFGRGHAVLKAFDVLPGHMSGALDTAVPSFETAHALLKAGRVGSLIAGARADAEDDVLTQAEQLAEGDYLAAAAVLAGGALETHLRYLCESNGITWEGSGSISAYEQALSRARKNGTELLSKLDAKQVTAWGDARNTAAHTPASFDLSRDRVTMIIQGVRDFIVRHSG